MVEYMEVARSLHPTRKIESARSSAKRRLRTPSGAALLAAAASVGVRLPVT